MKRFLTLTVLLTIGIISYGQLFEKNYDLSGDSDECRAMTITSDGSFILAGASWASDVAFYDMSIAKIKANGDTAWTKAYGVGSMNIEVAYGVVNASDGGYMLIGGTDGFVDDGESDFWVIKTDASGDSVWSKHYGGVKSEYAHAGAITSDNGYIFVGATNSYGAGLDDIYIVRAKENGDTLWTKTYGTNKMDCAYGVQQTSDGGFILAGEVANGEDAYALKIDADGNKVWDYTYEGAGTDNFYSCIQSSDGKYVIVGRTQSEGAGGQDVFVVKLDTDGTEIWKKVFGGEKKDEGWSVVEDADGNYFITGYTESFTHEEEDSDMWLLKIDSDGNKIWSVNYGGVKDDGGYAGVVTSTGFAGAGYTYVQNEGTNFYLVSVNSSGLTGDDTEAPSVPQNVAASAVSGTQIDLSWDNSTDNVAVVGYVIHRGGEIIDSTYYTSYQDTGLTVNTEYAYTISAYDAAGNESAQSASVSATTTTDITSNTIKQLSIYPNPLTNTAVIEFDNPNNVAYTLNIINTNGQIVKTIQNITDNNITISKNNLSNGVYFVELKGDNIYRNKLIIE